MFGMVWTMRIIVRATFERHERRGMGFDLLAFLGISYLIVVGIVLMVLASIQEAAETRPELDTRWNITTWSRPRFVATGALIALPSLLILVPLGLLLVV